MASTDLLVTFFPSILKENINKKEKQLLEAIFFILLYRELDSLYQSIEQNFMEDIMICGSLIKKLMNDLLVNKDYSVEGLANYTGCPVDVIYDVVSGVNINPTVTLSTKIIELHALSRRELYEQLLQKIIGKIIE